jgi:predicted transcriptional regulator
MAVDLIQTFPDSSTLEDIQYHLFVREKVERGLVAARKGQIVSQEDVEKRVRKWLKSTGRSRR